MRLRRSTRDAGVKRLPLAKDNEVEPARDERQRHAHRKKERRHGRNLLPGRAGQASRSIQKVMSRSWRSSDRKIKSPMPAIGERGHRETAQEKECHRGAAVAGRKARQHERGRQRAGKAGKRQHRQRHRRD